MKRTLFAIILVCCTNGKQQQKTLKFNGKKFSY